jgi:anti-sigma regulatory factor (Ser/Thr protein kinase)
MAKLNLRKFIAEHYKGGVTARDVIREALTNAIHAGGKSIAVDLHFSDKNGELFAGTEERRVLERITITDDGEGFTNENLQYFDEICTSHKDDIGGKGVGRLAFLKYANQVDIRSQLQNVLVEFEYTPDFKPEDVRKTEVSGTYLGGVQADSVPEDVRKTEVSGTSSTCIVLRDLKGKINTQVAKLVNSICDDLRLLLFLKFQQGQSITLTFTHNSGQPFEEIYAFSGASIRALAEREFDLEGEVFKCYLFRDEPPKKGIVAMLCADDLCIEEYVISRRFDIGRHLIFVTSPYFNSRSNIERQRLELPKTNDDADIASPISREKLMPRIHEECMGMINETATGDIDQFKASNVEKLKKYYPFIKVNSLGNNASLLDADEVVRNYRAQLARDEDRLVDSLEKGNPVSLDDISHLASEDLARYIVHRALVIDSLANMPPSSAEIAIHNAILPKKSKGSDIRENNVWLVDDKFLSYSNIFSDETLAKIVSDVGKDVEDKQQRKPDVAVFFSKDNESQPNKLVIIEFKKPGADIFENNKALLQCRLYAGALVDRISTIREVFAFSIVEIDDEFHKDMKQTGFKDVFSLTERVVYNDFQIGASGDIPLHMYVMPVAALITDAKARNRVFEEVLEFDLSN